MHPAATTAPTLRADDLLDTIPEPVELDDVGRAAEVGPHLLAKLLKEKQLEALSGGLGGQFAQVGFLDVKMHPRILVEYHIEPEPLKHLAQRAGELIDRHAGVLVNVSVRPAVDESALVPGKGVQRRATRSRRREGQCGSRPVVAARSGNEFTPFAISIPMDNVAIAGLVLKSG